MGIIQTGTQYLTLDIQLVIMFVGQRKKMFQTVWLDFTIYLQSEHLKDVQKMKSKV